MNKYASYVRVSTEKQGINGLGMDGQREAVRKFLEARPGSELVKQFEEVETGKRRDRPELLKALELCRREKAVLVIAKLDRLARNASFLLGLRDAGVEFVACDMPQADRLTVGILACIAEREAEMISQRTKEGLAAAKRRGIKLGNPRAAEALVKARVAKMDGARNYVSGMMPVLRELVAAKVTSFRGLARCLNARGMKTQQGKNFQAQTVKNVILAGRKSELE